MPNLTLLIFSSDKTKMFLQYFKGEKSNFKGPISRKLCICTSIGIHEMCPKMNFSISRKCPNIKIR